MNHGSVGISRLKFIANSKIRFVLQGKSITSNKNCDFFLQKTNYTIQLHQLYLASYFKILLKMREIYFIL